MIGISVSYPLFSASIWAFILIAVSIVELIAAYGAWNLKQWSWNLLVGIMIFGIIQSLLFISVSGIGGVIFGLIIDGIVLYYLFQIKNAFVNK
ncbi:hypothetical protein COX95_02855 [bacterium CG_4_10_14_0_2_um_filter_33_32]|nr:MAG: hypothetical protein AUJ93_02665 [bacterium CG2_30_33_46]PIR67968.1 MAG: hypothetical protein COU50_00400 [bacterium CG10_big_fil_rev_8_21_14_0_10_33_18]PIU77083.1 MAG: hypothetical protein COS74_00575 [bacterium CG06_land_8_20_14_3_00_33_50]PIW81180.1 MAG: hypothetical protein COZ97_03035 [bacterium CG_4_8_14_3_um_filter_33_28]PIY85033.1 MAG: hypothetical protein COY76_04185 [bacterium CG_4_10_14_0_8_um_filter_33_57]PIZ85783.1 MAG: hypothetical protein COX95_02855 [bacterium CG_4_10_1